jgi:glycosyltransferase involved in cell wall biosynthesis
MDTKQKIAIVTHELIYGVPQALRDYLIKRKTSSLLFIGLPFIDSRKASVISYRKGTKTDEKVVFRHKSLGILDYFIDFFQVIWWIYSRKENYDLFIGVNNLNSLAGLFLKKMGKVKKVIFYTMDFVPLRFNNRILNYIYHQIEIVCVKKCDEVWNVSPRMAKGREDYLGLSEKKYFQRHVPVGIWNDKVKKRSFEQIKKNQILFIGHLSTEKQGVQMVLEALPAIIKEIKDIKFLVVGGGWHEEILRNKAKELKLGDHVSFTGWIKDRSKLDEMMSESAIAVATYKPEKKILRNFTYFADPYKLKDYLGAGLPVVLTDISYNAKELEKRECGIIVKYDSREIAQAIMKLLKDEVTLKQYRINALKYAKELDWTNIYDKIFK